jgi:hypothetical protein
MMQILIILGSIFTPIAMLVIQRKWMKWGLLFNEASILSAVIFGDIALDHTLECIYFID